MPAEQYRFLGCSYSAKIRQGRDNELYSNFIKILLELLKTLIDFDKLLEYPKVSRLAISSHRAFSYGLKETDG